ncbi:MAG: RloB family protein [Bacteroidales bacterium]|nr:RloB family protein [Bacteroidales bacterium]
MRGKVRKSIALIGEGITEKFYFESLKAYRRFKIKIEPAFPSHSDIEDIVNLAEKFVLEEYDYVVCLIDMDKIIQNQTELKKYKRYKKRLLDDTNRIRKTKKLTLWFIETNPCTEFWFLLHFLPSLSTKKYQTQDELIKELQKYMPGYEKTKHYFKRTDLFCYLNQHGDINRAMQNAEKLCEKSKENPEDEISYSEIYKVINLINELQSMV